MIIKNTDSLATTESRRAVLEIVEAGIARVLPSVILPSALVYDRVQQNLRICGQDYPLSRGRLFIIGGGKASNLMAKSVEALLGAENITDGIVICKDSGPETDKVKIVRAGHPVPDQRGLDGVHDIMALKNRYAINNDDLLLCLISGGGSALMPCPVDGITLEDKQQITGLLLASGAEIEEINSVRKHLSQVKGGRLGSFFAPATVVSLILSDVIGNDLSTIASGPTVPDHTTFQFAYSVLEKYHLVSEAPEAVIKILREGYEGRLEETPKSLDNCHNYIIGDNRLALEAMALKATEMGFSPKIITSEQKGDTAFIARLRAEEIIRGENSAYNVILLGGETTLQLPAVCGKGGRNQHYAAVSLLAMQDYQKEWVMASVGTDGSDFLPDVAGAMIDKASLSRLTGKKIEVQPYIDNCDSYTLLKDLGNSLIATGGTGTNVGDVIVYLLK